MTTHKKQKMNVKRRYENRTKRKRKRTHDRGRPSLGWPTYDEAKILVKARGIASREAYRKWIDAERIQFLPKQPNRTYDDWVSWNDFLGTANLMRNDKRMKKDYLPWWEAVRWAQASGIKTWAEWKEACRAGRVPLGIPHWPNVTYKEEWDVEVWFGKTLMVKVEAMERVPVTWVLVHMKEDPVGVVWFLKVNAEEVKKGRESGWEVMRMWEYESELEEQVWELVQLHSSEYFGEREHRLCSNVPRMMFALDSKLLIVNNR